MKLAIIALVAAAAAKTTSGGTVIRTIDASDWSTCKNGGDCVGDGFYCCSATKTKSGTDAPAGENICVQKDGTGTVPNNSKTPYAGFTYFCSVKHITDPTNNVPSIIPANGAATIAVSATSAAVAAFMLA